MVADLRYASLSGVVPDWLTSLTDLRQLLMGGGPISGTIESKIFDSLPFLELM